MSRIICLVPAAPLRAEAAHRSEMVSQLLFGEFAEVIEAHKDFLKLRCDDDGYTGWIQASQTVPVPGDIYTNAKKILTAGRLTEVLVNDQPMFLPMGASLGFLQDGKAALPPYDVCCRGGETWDPVTAPFSEESLLERAFAWLNTAYLWGGRSVFGVDCSGYVQQLFRFFEYALPRDAWQQAELGSQVGFLEESICGDLAFFDNAEGRIIHVGMLLKPDTIIHASGKVRIDHIDNMGIIHAQTGERTHTLRLIKRYLRK